MFYPSATNNQGVIEVFKTLSDLDPNQPPLRFTHDPEEGLVIKAEDVISLITASQSVLAQQGITMSLSDPKNADRIVEAAVLGCEAMGIIKASCERLFLEAGLHG
jgi:hypothetical protein